MKKVIVGLLALGIVAIAGANILAPGLVYDSTLKGTRLAAGFATKEIKVGEYSYSYLDNEQTDKPLIVMIHGFTADKDNWPRMALFLDDYHIIAPDLLGHGDSDRPLDEDYSYDAQVARVKAFVDALDLPKFHLIGNSMGGAISGFYAARYSEDLLSVSLLDNAAIDPPTPSDLDKLLAAGGPMPLIMRKPEDSEMFFDYVFVEPPFMTEGIRQHFAESQILHQELYTHIFHDLNNSSSDLSQELGNINVPVQIIWGDSDRLLHVSSIDVMAPVLENETVVIMKNCGHTPMLERPKETAEHLRLFIESI